MTTTFTVDGIDAFVDADESDIPVLQPGADVSLTFVTRPENDDHVSRYEQIRDIGASAPAEPIVNVSSVTSRPAFVERTRPAAPRSEVVVKVENDGTSPRTFGAIVRATATGRGTSATTAQYRGA